MFPVAALIIKSFSLLSFIEKFFLSLPRHIENQLGKRIKKHLFARILEQNKQTNQIFLYVQKSVAGSNCYLIPADNKNSIFIPEQRKNRLNHFLKITNGLVPKERIGIHVTLSELLTICQKLQYREKSSSKQIKNKHSALILYPSDA